METKIVDKVRENIKSYNGKNGTTYVHGITLVGDPQEWDYNSLSPQCTKFVPKEEATFTTEVRQNGQYTNHIIKPIQPQKPVTSFGPRKQEQKDQGTISWLSCFSSVCNRYTGTNETFPNLLNYANLAFDEAVKHSDKK